MTTGSGIDESRVTIGILAIALVIILITSWIIDVSIRERETREAVFAIFCRPQPIDTAEHMIISTVTISGESYSCEQRRIIK